MQSDTPTFTEAPVPDKRSRNRLVLALLGMLCGLLISGTGKFLTDYEGPWGIRLAVMLAPWALLGVLAFFSRRFYKADELEVLINRQALAFAFYAALLGLVVQHQLQAAGFVPAYAWTAKKLLFGLVLLMTAGILWSKRRYN